MHVLLLPSWYPRTPNDVGGVFFRDQALALHNYGHKVGVITVSMRSLRTWGKGCSSRKPLPFENDNGVFTYRKELFAALPRIPFGNYQLFKNAARKLLRQYVNEHGKPDILHAHAAVFGGAAGAELSKEFGIPLVLTEHSTEFARGGYSGWQLKLAKKAIQGASVCIAVSPSLADLLSGQFPSSKGRWLWVPNVVADRFKMPKGREGRERSIRFLNIALMTEKKGQLDLLTAFNQLRNAGLDAELWLAGDGPLRSKLEQTAANIGVTGYVRFLGLIAPEQVPALLAEVDVMVVSSHYETFGVVAAEALMAGVPVVATRCGGPECIVEEGDGLLVPPKHPIDLGNAMQRVAENLAGYNPVNIAERANVRFSGAAVAARLTDVYQRLLSSNFSSKQSG